MAIEAGRELIILGLLRRGPLSAYALTRAVQMHGPLYRLLGRGNIYQQLAQLEDCGVVTARTEPALRGPRKKKTVYALAAAGKRRFDALLSTVFLDPQTSDATFEVACVLLGQLNRESAIGILNERLRALDAQLKRVLRLYGKPEERSGAALLAMTHATSRVENELKWTKTALRNLRNPRWKPEWIVDDETTAKTRRLR